MTGLKMGVEARSHLYDDIIPFWKSLRDNEYGGYYGYMGYDLGLDKKAVKGCILNSRITWFFTNAYMLFKDESLLNEARHGFEFMKNKCMDRSNGGFYWSLNYDGTPNDTTKHTYNQAFAIYALSSYYEASGDGVALDMAYTLYDLIEGRMRDELGYREAFDEGFNEIDNDLLSENGVTAKRTMNTLLHVFEAYTELYRVDGDERVASKLKWIMDVIADKVYNPEKHRLDVFFDDEWKPLIDLHSYGHDIEAAWLIDRCTDILDDKEYADKMGRITRDLTNQIYGEAFDGSSLANECENGVVDEWRIWWVQAETVVGFLNGSARLQRLEYEGAAKSEWKFIKEYVIDRRDGYKAGREWYWRVSKNGTPDRDKPIVEPWKCPYHDGRMCLEIIRRTSNDRNGI